MQSCPTCGQNLPRPMGEGRITDQELNVLSAWWHFGSVRAVARFFGRAESTIKNQLMDARRRHGIHTTLELAQMYMAQLRTIDQLSTSHNRNRRAVA